MRVLLSFKQPLAGGNDTLPLVETLGPTGRAPLAVRRTPAKNNDTLPLVETLGPTGRSRLPLPTQAGTPLAVRRTGCTEPQLFQPRQDFSGKIRQLGEIVDEVE